MKRIISGIFSGLICLTAAAGANAAGKVYMKCGDFTFSTSGTNDGFPRINGAKPEYQKLTFLKQKEDYENIKMDWRMATNQPGRWVGLEYIKRNGKAILNAQWLQASMDAPRQYATYDCVKVK
ncbi:TPA: hypothetical protein ACPT1G_005422 [Escherichia coli]|jgi:hypothetical protein|uniref:Secreted protein n=2 Tax=Escherichia coli TaxID=562 RepID=A0AB73R620_ECOLX|nr:hypothetical protein [Escherichia coli]EFI8904221.1 hypothetical protein [Escherichia coli]EFN8010612.1 hypothetical protein [Escherichia coli]EFU7669544.1 hypothetical protein [Escherichia coli]EGD7678329.1 hypothetical protein [Escherichia coli]EGE3145947.1 hypothetical protein [Escherichia coli]